MAATPLAARLLGVRHAWAGRDEQCRMPRGQKGVPWEGGRGPRRRTTEFGVDVRGVLLYLLGGAQRHLETAPEAS